MKGGKRIPRRESNGCLRLQLQPADERSSWAATGSRGMTSSRAMKQSERTAWGGYPSLGARLEGRALDSTTSFVRKGDVCSGAAGRRERLRALRSAEVGPRRAGGAIGDAPRRPRRRRQVRQRARAQPVAIVDLVEQAHAPGIAQRAQRAVLQLPDPLLAQPVGPAHLRRGAADACRGQPGVTAKRSTGRGNSG